MAGRSSYVRDKADSPLFWSFISIPLDELHKLPLCIGIQDDIRVRACHQNAPKGTRASHILQLPALCRVVSSFKFTEPQGISYGEDMMDG